MHHLGHAVAGGPGHDGLRLCVLKKITISCCHDLPIHVSQMTFIMQVIPFKNVTFHDRCCLEQ